MSAHFSKAMCLTTTSTGARISQSVVWQTIKAKIEQREQNSLFDSNLCDIMIATTQRDMSMKGKINTMLA